MNKHLLPFSLGSSLVLLLLIFGLSNAMRVEPTKKHTERYYQKIWCFGKGEMEYVLKDRTRVDCLTDDYAIEFDFSKKWHEAIGQSLGYSLHTGKQAGVVLIIKKPKHYKHWIKLNSVISHFKLPIQTWKIEAYKN